MLELADKAISPFRLYWCFDHNHYSKERAVTHSFLYLAISQPYYCLMGLIFNPLICFESPGHRTLDTRRQRR